MGSDSECFASLKSLELNGSSWIYDQIYILKIDLYKDLTTNGSSYVELPKKNMSHSTIQNKIDIQCGIWCKVVILNPLKAIG